VGGLGWPAGSGAQQVSEHRRWHFSGASSPEPGIWLVGRCWASAVCHMREQSRGQAGPANGFGPEAKENRKGFSIFQTF
jgi:hypothetical protein